MGGCEIVCHQSRVKGESETGCVMLESLLCVVVVFCDWQMKKAGEKGWTEFQSLWTDPQEEGGVATEMEQGETGREEGERGREEEGVADLLGSFSEESASSGSAQQGPSQGSRTGMRSYGSTSYGSTERGPVNRGELCVQQLNQETVLGAEREMSRGVLSIRLLVLCYLLEPLLSGISEPPDAETNSPSWDDPSWGPSGSEPPDAETNSPSWDDPSWGSSGGWGDNTHSTRGGGRGESEDTPLTKSKSGTKTEESDGGGRGGGWGDLWGWDTSDLRTAKKD